MDFATSITTLVGNVAGFLSIKPVIQSIKGYKAMRKELQRQCQDLQNVQRNVQGDVTQARNNGQEIYQNVNEWLIEVDVTVNEVNAWLTKTDGTTSCGPFPNCYQRYKLNSKASKRKDDVSSLVQSGNNFRQVAHPKPAAVGIELVSHDNFIVFDSIKKSSEQIMKALDSKSKVGVIGTGGIGKTTLVLEIGKKAKETKKFDQVVFAVVSQSVSIENIQGQLGDQLGLSFSSKLEHGRAFELRNRLKAEDSLLVILDDVWNNIQLADIGIPVDENHKILITTRRKQVCNSMELDETIKLSFLTEKEAWDLFSKNVGGKLDNPSDELEVVAREVIRECGGLPLALVVVARALIKEDVEEWRETVDRLQNASLPDIEAVDRNVYACLKVSYDYLKGEATKKCFLLCSLFPEDHEISIEDLAKYAIGFGLFQDAKTFKAVQLRTRRAVKDLKESSLLLPTNMSEYVKVHDVVRDAALWITSTGEEVFLVPIRSHTNNWTRDKRLENATAISLLACNENKLLPDPEICSKLKMLLLDQAIPLPKVDDTYFTRMVALQVLDMTAIKAKNHPELVLPSSLQLLVKLQVLYLRGWKLGGDISSIGMLKKLEVLSFAGSVLQYVPKELLELRGLMFLDFSSCKVEEGYDPNIFTGLAVNIEKFLGPKNQIHDDADADADEEY